MADVTSLYAHFAENATMQNGGMSVHLNTLNLYFPLIGAIYGKYRFSVFRCTDIPPFLPFSQRESIFLRFPLCFPGWMDELRFYVFFNSISVISGRFFMIMKSCVQWNHVYD